MKIKDLIKQLKKYDQNMEVVFSVDTRDQRDNFGVLLCPYKSPKTIKATIHPRIVQTKDSKIYKPALPEDQEIIDCLLLT